MKIENKSNVGGKNHLDFKESVRGALMDIPAEAANTLFTAAQNQPLQTGDALRPQGAEDGACSMESQCLSAAVVQIAEVAARCQLLRLSESVVFFFFCWESCGHDATPSASLTSAGCLRARERLARRKIAPSWRCRGASCTASGDEVVCCLRLCALVVRITRASSQTLKH